MKKWVLNKLMEYIKKYKETTEEEDEIILYGLEAIYLLLVKLVIILTAAYFLGILKEVIIYIIFFNIIRTFAFGLHASKSSVCLIVSSIAFLGLPYLASKLSLPIIFKLVTGIICTVLIFKNSPADTYKRPIVSPVRRKRFKLTSTFISIVYVILSFFLNSFLSNCLLFSLILEVIFISPLTYKIFKLPYNNYIKYLEREDENVFC